MEYSKHAQLALTIFTREEVEEVLKEAAKLRLIGRMYIGCMGEAVVRWQEDGTVEVIIPHTPTKLDPAT